ncbi:MAG: hypothetical protein GF393_10845, partial [Armatimonadia bacterium]|nr:hypothetical protein [Armatimonadia bacterium]
MIARIVLLLVMTVTVASAQTWEPERFPIGFWAGPPADYNTLETWQTAAEGNFTFVGPRGGFSLEENLKMLDLCEHAGIKVLVTDPRIGWTMTATPEWEETIGEIVSDYSDHPALFGYYLKDEPNFQTFEALGKLRAEFVGRDPEHLAYINLFPTYANVQQLGTPTYADHVEKYMQIVAPRVLSYDHYCLRRDGSIRPDYFENLAIIRDVALRHGANPWQIILSTEHLSYRAPTEGEMRWQAYTSLAYGMKGLMYFTYWSHPSREAEGLYAIVTSEGEPHRLYPIIRDLNAEVLALGDTLLGLTSTGVYHTGEIPAGGTRLGTDAIVRLPEELPLIVGMFEDAEGAHYAMIVNRDYAQPVEVPVRLLPHVTGVDMLSAETGESEALELVDRAITLSLRPGGGRLLRLHTEFAYPQPPKIMDRIEFTFNRDGDAEGWTRHSGMSSPIVADGVLRSTIGGRDPHISRGMLRVPADTHSALKVRMRITGGADEAQVFWGIADEPGFRDDKYLNFPIQPDGQWHEYTIPVGEHEKWAGQEIVALRLDPSV